MKKKTVFFSIVLLLVGFSSLSAQMTKKQLQDMYVAQLRTEGYRDISVDSDGDVVFKVQRDGATHNFYIDVMENDLQSFRIVLSDYIPMGSNRQRALDAAVSEIITTKGVSFNLASGDRIAINSFNFLAKPEDCKAVIKRMVDNILIARKDFVAKNR